MSKMHVTYENRSGMNGDPNKSQTLIVCRDASDHKESLKEPGSRWNSIGKSWEKETSDESFMTEFVKIVVSCGMTYDDVLNAFQFIPETVQSSNIEEKALAAYNVYMDAHPEWF